VRRGDVGRFGGVERVGDGEVERDAQVGSAPPSSELVDDQPAFFDLVRSRGGAQLTDPGIALGYVLGFLEVTRGPSVLVRPIHNIADIPWRPGTAEEEGRRAALLADSPIRPPTAVPADDGFRVEVWLVVDQRIQLNSFDVAHDGTMATEFRVVAADLPLPIAR